MSLAAADETETRGGGALTAVRVWDWPTRVVHWAFVALMAGGWWTAEKAEMGPHRLIGYALLGLVAFRIYWGFLGSSTARFGGFVRGPAAVAAYARGLLKRGAPPGTAVIGHNPMGGWSILLMLAGLSALVVLGLFAVDVDGLEPGPLGARISFDAGRAAAHWHHTVFNILLAVIALHLFAVVFYAAFKRENLVGPMLSGRRRYAERVEGMTAAAAWRLLVGVALATALAVWAAKGFPV